ncbi:MAG TPA: hypothetical protein VNP91_13190 [Methylomirabilota bacterium]|nr:hypothetical protein [Methylomirabilota bacterium]
MTLGRRALLLLLTALWTALAPSATQAAGVAVRFTEGLTRGFLLVRAPDGRLLGQGDLIQIARGHRVESQMILRLADGSIYDERVVFTQDGVFALLSYHLVQHGPAFPERLDAVFDVRDGRYSVTSGSGKSEKAVTGQMTMPADVSNGMAITLLKNLPRGPSQTVHVVAFTPKPRLIELELVPVGQQQAQVGELRRAVERYVLKPRLSPIMGLMAKLLGRKPTDIECLIFKADVPAFVRCDGALSPGGPVWRIEVTSPVDRRTSIGSGRPARPG